MVCSRAVGPDPVDVQPAYGGQQVGAEGQVGTAAALEHAPAPSRTPRRPGRRRRRPATSCRASRRAASTWRLEQLAVGVDVAAADGRDQLGVAGLVESLQGASLTSRSERAQSVRKSHANRVMDCVGAAVSILVRRTRGGVGRGDLRDARARTAPPADPEARAELTSDQRGGAAAAVRGGGGGPCLGDGLRRCVCRRGPGARPRRCLARRGPRRAAGDQQRWSVAPSRRTGTSARCRRRGARRRSATCTGSPARTRSPASPAWPTCGAASRSSTGVSSETGPRAQHTHALVVVEVSRPVRPRPTAASRSPLTCGPPGSPRPPARSSPGRETLGRLGPHRIVVVTDRDERLAQRVEPGPPDAGPARGRRRGSGSRGCPTDDAGAAALLDELAHPLDAPDPVAVGASRSLTPCAVATRRAGRPEDLVEEFEVVESRIQAPLEADYNVAPTKEVYAVVERPPSKDVRGAAAAPAAGAHLGADPVLGEGPLDRQPDDQRPDGDRRREAGVQAGVRRAPLPAAGRRLLRVVPHLQKTKAGKPLQAAVLHPAQDGGILAMAGLYEIWRDPTE